MDAKKYLQQTENAIRQLLNSAIAYETLIEKWISSSQTKNPIITKRNLEDLNEYLGLQFSQATLCGSILQVAFMGIDRFSTNTVVLPKCLKSKDENKIPTKFCIGRIVHDIPIGMLIYAGRNQYNHWDDENLNSKNTQVFNALLQAYYNDPLFDLVYDLNYPDRQPKSHYIVLNELKWRDYDTYIQDMTELIM